MKKDRMNYMQRRREKKTREEKQGNIWQKKK
jgi:hypothetical protein